jgi:hypothetical protein
LLTRKAADAIEDSLTDFLGAEVWRVLRNKLDCSCGVRLDNILERSTAVKFAQALNEMLPPAAPFILDKVSARLMHDFPRIRDADQLSNFLHVVNEVRRRYDGANVLSGLENHQHVALVYRSENDFSKILSSFCAAGAKKNRLNVLVCPEELQEHAKALMANASLAEASSSLSQQQQQQQQSQQNLVMLDCTKLDVGKTQMRTSMESTLRSVCKAAAREKKSGLNVLGLCPSHLLAHENYLNCMALEDAWEDLVSTVGLPVSLVCPYIWDPCIPESRLEQNHNHGVRYL